MQRDLSIRLQGNDHKNISTRSLFNDVNEQISKPCVLVKKLTVIMLAVG